MGFNALSLAQAMQTLATLVDEHQAHEIQEPVRAPMDASVLRDRLRLELNEEGNAIEDVLQDVRKILRHTPATASSRFFNQLFGGRDHLAVLGDALAAVLNTSMYTYKVGGPHILLEMELIQHMGRLLGWEKSEGIFTPGGSLSNLCGMMIARNRACPNIMESGADGHQLRVYSSEDSHYSIRRAAAVLGIGRANLVQIETDNRGRMIPKALDQAIRRDLKNGLQPILVNATAGTTVLGAMDPLDALSEVARFHGAWFHVDAAYGGSLAFHPELKKQLLGIEHADSVTWDAHKMMGVPLTCSVLLVRHPGVLTENLNEAAPYLFQDDTEQLNPGTRSLQCARRNDALKLWLAWKVHGDRGYQERMRKLRELTLFARNHVQKHPRLHLVKEPESMNLCFQVQGMTADKLCTRLNQRGLAMISHAFVDGEAVVRLAFENPEISNADVEDLFSAILSCSSSQKRELSASDLNQPVRPEPV